MSITILQQNDPIQQQWIVGSIIGTGGFSTVYLVTSSLDSSITYVGKVSNKKNKRSIDFMVNEIEKQKSLKHKNIVEIITSFETVNHHIIILPYYEAGSLYDLLKLKKKLKEVECKDLFHQILSGLKYLKDSSIVHRDIKPANILLKVNQEKAQRVFDSSDEESEEDHNVFIYDVYICDFGFATEVTDKDCLKVIGTPNFIAVELLNCDNDIAVTDINQLFKIDIWSSGVLFSNCLIGTPVFQTASVKTTYDKIKKCDWSFPNTCTLTESAKQLIGSMIKLKPENRKCVEELLQDPFFIN
ncbi:MAG: protein kinase [Barrevirus sp.]|uniref:Protein kinase n=1 Tax=Barrevirus sp. TaxID=2487763 RepID=A0A3G4ZSG5_9VIRU|nr:MAG: protein kinase [Barrevirus sp.]